MFSHIPNTLVVRYTELITVLRKENEYYSTVLGPQVCSVCQKNKKSKCDVLILKTFKIKTFTMRCHTMLYSLTLPFAITL